MVLRTTTEWLLRSVSSVYFGNKFHLKEGGISFLKEVNPA